METHKLGKEMTTVWCPKCAVTTTVRQECASCKATGFKWINLRNPDSTIHPVKRECKKCKGRGLIEKPVTYKNEMIFIHPQEADPSRWVCLLGMNEYHLILIGHGLRSEEHTS